MHGRMALGIMAFAKEVSPSTPSTEDNHTQGLAITDTHRAVHSEPKLNMQR